LERAFLLEQLQRRMEVSGQIEASDGSGSEGVGTVSAAAMQRLRASLLIFEAAATGSPTQG